MKENIKRKLANKSAFMVILLLALSVITVTVFAIATTVANKTEPDIDTDVILPDDTETNTNPEPDKEDDKVPPKPAPIYKTPCAGQIQKPFSDDVLVFSQTMNDHRVHLGVDISAAVGDKVCSFSDGKIEKISNDYFMGKTVIISHENGIKSVYSNLSETLSDGICEGKEVKAGEIIGTVGETAICECADSSHLHFEILQNGKQINPAKLIKFPEKPSENK